MPIVGLLSLHRRAVLASVEAVSRIRADDLARPTPCAEWAVADLLAHMTAQHHGFAAAAEGHGGDPAVWTVQPLGEDPVADYAAAAERVLSAFARDGVLERTFTLAEFRPVSTFPATSAIGFHLIDYVVHGWDVARSLGLPYELHPALADTALRIALEVPDGKNRLAPGSAFQPSLAVAADAGPLAQILSALGRCPTWPR
ncbi:MAG: TIGR03086 family protein [Kutzneria sp.]|nr:TIGR03086 family protein [Kutzneria sp.]